MDLSSLWIIARDSHTNALHRVRRLTHILSSLALVAGFAACSGNLPGTQTEPPPRRGLLSPTRPAPRPVPPPAMAPAPVPAAGVSPTTVAPNSYYPSAAPSAPPPAAAPAVDARERQFEIMNEAVAALRQEVSRSYAQTEELTREADRLRALVTSLRRDLSKSRDENKALKSHIRELERRLHEVRTPAPETDGSAAQPPEDAAARRRAAPAPAPQAPAEPAPDVADGGTEAPPQ